MAASQCPPGRPSRELQQMDVPPIKPAGKAAIQSIPGAALPMLHARLEKRRVQQAVVASRSIRICMTQLQTACTGYSVLWQSQAEGRQT